MKKLFILSAVAVLATAAVSAQGISLFKKETKFQKEQKKEARETKKKERKEIRKLEGHSVSEQSKNSFAADFGNVAAINMTRADNMDRFNFYRDGAVVSAFYDADAVLVGTTEAKKFEDLPAKAQKYINQHYKDYTTVETILFDDNEYNATDMFLYGRQFDDQDSYFIELAKGSEKVVLHVSMAGDVAYYTSLK